MILYPAVDLMDGCCVRLSQGDFGSKKVYERDPAAVLARFKAAGARHVHLVDLDGAKDPAARQTALVSALARTSGLAIQAGGGIRCTADISALLQAGVERVVLGTVAVESPTLFGELLRRFGGGRLTLALDAFVGPRGARVATRGWTNKTALEATELITIFLAAGLERVLCTDIAKDGMLEGPNLELYRQIAAAFPTLELQASGGVRGLGDLLALKAVPVHSAVVGKALYETRLDLSEAIRLC